MVSNITWACACACGVVRCGAVGLPLQAEPFPKETRLWSVTDVMRWLDTLSLGQYKQSFKEASVDGEFLLELREEDLMQVRVRSFGPASRHRSCRRSCVAACLAAAPPRRRAAAPPRCRAAALPRC